MKIIQLKERKQFENLKQWDMLIVKWSDYYVEHTLDCKKVMFYRIYKNQRKDYEIICQKKNNHYFNWNRFLDGDSVALEVYQVINE